MTKSLLLIDDDNDDFDLFCEALGEIDSSIQYEHSVNGYDALDLLKKTDTFPDIIFLDVNMPQMDGWECLIRLKEEYKEIPVIMYSTSTVQAEIDRALQLGALKFISKPDSYQALKETLKAALTSI